MKIHKVDLLPLVALIIYIVIGVLLSFFGPIEYEGYEKLPVAIYMSSFFFLFIMSYLLALLKNRSVPVIQDAETEQLKLNNILFLVKMSLLIIFIVQASILLFNVLHGSLNVSVTKIGAAYVDFYDGYERGTGNVSFIFLVQTLTYVFYLTSLILGAFYYKDLSWKYRFMTVFVYVSIILIETIGHGTQKQLGDMLIFLSLIYLFKVDLLNKQIRRKVYRRLYLFGVIGVGMFAVVLYSRYSALGIDASNINEKALSVLTYNTDHIIFKIFGDSLGFPLVVFAGYLSQGYYGLSLSMQQPFVWTYFVGNSYSLMVFLNRYLGIPVDFHNTYPYRASLYSVWDDSKWSTIFAWFAGDFTFCGTLILFMFIAYLYALLWREAYRYKNPISIILFSMLTIGLLYIPANNQLLHTPGSFIAFFFFLFLWALRHKKYNFMKR